MKFRRDCKDFSGIYSCDTMKYEKYKDCEKCKFYRKINKKILIIKLGQIGDVLRTTPILKALKEKYKNCSIVWLTNEVSKDVFKNNNYVDEVLVYNSENILRLKYEKFYAVYNFEIDRPATLIANLVKAKKKFGYYFAKDGKTFYFNESAKYYFERANSDFVNRNNTRSYQEMMFDIAELEWKEQEYVLRLTDEEKKYAERFKFKKKVLGLNIGSSKRWQAKKWSEKKIIEFVKKVKKDYDVILLGGLNEREEKPRLAKKLKVKENDTDNSLREFFSVIDRCDVLVTGDTMAMHAGIALKKKVIGLFFCTPTSEIYGYGRLRKVVSPLLDEYFYWGEYDERLGGSIGVESVINEIREVNSV